mgnify:CR=1 FL=1
MKKIIAISAVAAGMLLAAGGAEAQWSTWYDYRPGYGNYHYYSTPYYHYPRQWHDTSHWDYHQPTYQWHGNHWHVTPGHYDWHNDGHWH